MSGFFTTNASNPPHCTLNSCFGALYSVWVHLLSFCNCMRLGANRGELVQLIGKLVPRSHTGMFCNERIQSTTLDPKLMFWCVVIVHLLSFCNCMKLGAKRGDLVQLMQKFVPRSHIGIFRNNAPNPPHWTLN